jgi:hypothetical protein
VGEFLFFLLRDACRRLGLVPVVSEPTGILLAISACGGNTYLQLCEANGANRPHDDKPDQTADCNDSAQHRDIVRLGAVGESAHARDVCQGQSRRWDVFDCAEVCGVWKLDQTCQR